MSVDVPPNGIPFASLLRRHRRGAGLTQEQLGERAGLSVRTIRELEAGRTRHPHRGSVRLLADALGLPEQAAEEFLAAARGDLGVEQTWLPPDAVSVLPATGLVGRDDLVATVAATLRATPSLITLSGLSGVGKTCVAAEAARILHDEDGYDVWWVSLRPGRRQATASNPASDLALPDDLARHLAARPGLLVLDAVEHWQDAGDCVARLRRGYPTLRVLATGIQPLRVAGEHRWTVGPLALPADGEVSAASLGGVPAVQMFVDRLRQRQPGYRLTDVDAAAVAVLVRRLDGLPLALELVAGHGRVFTPADLLRRYGTNVLDLSSRYSLRDLLGQSIELLHPRERRLLEDMSVFVRPWTVRLAAGAASDNEDLAGSLDRLCEMGLVNPTVENSTMRFHVPDSVRQLALERLAARDGLAAARQRHADAVLAAASTWAKGLNGPQHLTHLEELDRSFGDIVEALATAEELGHRAAVTTAAALSRYWCTRSRTDIGREFVEQLVAQSTATGDLAYAHLQLARILLYEARQDEAVTHLREALGLFGRIADRVSEVDALLLLTRALREQRRFSEGTESALRAFRLAARIGDTARTAAARNNLTFDDLRFGRYDAALRRLRRVSQALAPTSRGRGIVALNEADTLRLAGRAHEAREAYVDAAALLRPFREPALLAQVHCRLAICDTDDGDLSAAEDHLTEARLAAREGTDDAATAWVALAAGVVARGRGHRRAARTHLQTALERFADRGRRREMVEVAVLLVTVAPPAERAASTALVTRLCAEGEVRLTGQEARLVAPVRAA